jgi:membrane-associated phospholipid phosphatase
MDKVLHMINSITGINLNFKLDNGFEISLQDIICVVGFSAPGILLVVSIFLLKKKTKYLKYFLAGYVLNSILNLLLKYIFKEPRPSNDWELFKIGITHCKRFGYDRYGMPSGHAQHCGYVLAFMTLVLNNPWVTCIYLIFTLICMYQRYLYENHNIKQVVVGLLIGLGSGYLMYEVATKKLIGNIKMRPDDDGPL